jgi:hypothetical protein
VDAGRSSVLVETSAQRLNEDLVSAVRSLSAGGVSGVYVSINRPYKTVRGVFSESGVDANSISFIDCITQPEDVGEGVVFVSDLSDLSSLSIATARMMENMPEGGFILVDAIHTLWIYHTPEFIARFVQGLAERAHAKKTKLVAFIVGSQDERLFRKLVPFFDGLVKLGS